MIHRFARGACRRLRLGAFSIFPVLALVAVPAAAQTVKETRVTFPSANAQRNGYELAGLDIIYLAEACAGEIHIGYAIEPGSLDVATGYWYEGHRYPIRSSWPQARVQSFSVQMKALHGARVFREWNKQTPATSNNVDCDTAADFFYVDWKALLGDRANDREARQNALASISLNTPFETDQPLRNPDLELAIRREIAAAEAAQKEEERKAEAARKEEEARKAEAARKAEEERLAEAKRAEEAQRDADAAPAAENPNLAQAAAPAQGAGSTAAQQEARAREEAQRRQQEQEAEERHARELERQRLEAERIREEERQAALKELGETLEQGILAGVAVTGYTAMPAVATEGVTQEFGLRFGQVGDSGGFLFGFGTNDLSMLSGGESTTNQLLFNVGGEIGFAPSSLGLSKAFMPYVGTYYKSIEFYEDLDYDQEEESWSTWGFNVGFMGVLGNFLVYQAGLIGDLDSPEINYMRGGDGGFFLSLGFQLGE